ncbi:MAG: hypothetical protein AB7Q17_07145 [Phycisphaerae bacterium]
MPKAAREAFLSELAASFGPLRKLDKSQSMYDVCNGRARLYIRYSKRHGKIRTFYGLRSLDLRELEGREAFICFLWDGQTAPLVVPMREYEEVFNSVTPAPDGQYKCQVLIRPDGADLYVASAGRFNVDRHVGWGDLEALRDATPSALLPPLGHPQIQTLLAAIGRLKGFDIWVPMSDRSLMDWTLTSEFECRASLPARYAPVCGVLREVDVLWIGRGSDELRALFEVEHSTPVYSGLLRLNDVRLTAPESQATYSIVASDARRGLFVRQLNRPTFRTSGLSERCGFLEYSDVYGWHRRTATHGNALRSSE